MINSLAKHFQRVGTSGDGGDDLKQDVVKPFTFDFGLGDGDGADAKIKKKKKKKKKKSNSSNGADEANANGEDDDVDVEVKGDIGECEGDVVDVNQPTVTQKALDLSDNTKDHLEGNISNGPVVNCIPDMNDEKGKGEGKQEVLPPSNKICEVSSTSSKKKKGGKKKSQSSATSQKKKNDDDDFYAAIEASLLEVSRMNLSDEQVHNQKKEKSTKTKVPATRDHLIPTPTPNTNSYRREIGPSFKSHKDPELTDEERNKRRYGTGKNLVAIGPPKVRDVNKFISNRIVTGAGTGVGFGIVKEDNIATGSSPFSFGFSM